MFKKGFKLLGCLIAIGNCFASDDDSTDSYGQSLSDRLLAAEHLVTVDPASIPELFSEDEKTTDMGVKYFVGISKLIMQSDIETGAKLVVESAIDGYTDAIGLIEFKCNVQVPSSPSAQVETTLKKLVW